MNPNLVIIHDNCHNALNNIDPNSIDLTVFSPPYDNIRDYDGYNFNYLELGKQIFDVTKDGGICAVIIQDGSKDFAKSLSSFRWAVDWVDKCGWRLFETCIYSKAGRPGAWWNQRFRVDHEYIHIFLKGDRPKYFNKEPLKIDAKYGGKYFHGTQRLTDGTLEKVEKTLLKPTKCSGTIWHYSVSSTEGNKIKLKHPATFPDKLVEDLILCFSQEGDTVLDPMCGSGTTIRVANNLNRNGIGIEISEKYINIIKEQLNEESDK